MYRSHTDFHANQTISMESTGKTSFMPLSRVWLSLWWFFQNSVTQYNFVSISCTEFYPNQMKNVEDTNKISFMPLSVRQFSWNSQSLNSIVCRSSDPNFTQISQEVQRTWVEIHLYIQENATVPELISTKLLLVWQLFVDNSYTEFHECVIGYLLTDTMSQTDGQMDKFPTWGNLLLFHKEHIIKYVGCVVYSGSFFRCNACLCFFCCHVKQQRTMHRILRTVDNKGAAKSSPEYGLWTVLWLWYCPYLEKLYL
jgi:hypothetical protein